MEGEQGLQEQGDKNAKPVVLWFTGLSGAGKTTVAKAVEEALKERGVNAAWLDGDVMRDYFPKTGFSKEERDAHIIKAGFIAKMLVDHGVSVVASFISPYRETRAAVREMCANFVEIHVAAPITVCEARDVKGLYAKARRGEITCFTGIDDPYEPPINPEIELDTANQTVAQSRDTVLKWLDNFNSD